MKRLTALVGAVAIMSVMAASSFAATVTNRTVAFKFSTPSNTIFELALYSTANNALTLITTPDINKGTITVGANGSDVSYDNLALKVTNNQPQGFLIKGTFRKFANADNSLQLPMWVYFGNGTGDWAPKGTITYPGTHDGLDDGVQKTVYTSLGQETEILLPFSVGTYVGGNTRGADLSSTVDFVITPTV